MHRSRRAYSVALLFLAGAGALVAGCGGGAEDNLPRQEVSGTVTFDGQPLAGGQIQFMPTSEAQGTQAGGAIKNGRYSIPRAAGPVPGAYRVSITSAVEVPAHLEGGMPGGAGEIPKEPIPPRYNSSSTLTAEVKNEGPNTFDFALQK